MAFALPTTGDYILATVIFEDYQGRKVTRQFYVAFNSSIDATLADVVTIADAFAALSEAKVAEVLASVPINDSAAAAAVGGAKTSEVARLSAQLATVHPITGNPQYQLLEVPAPPIAIFQGATGEAAKVVDVTNAQIVALLDQFKTGGAGFFERGQLADPLVVSGRSGTKRSG